MTGVSKDFWDRDPCDQDDHRNDWATDRLVDELDRDLAEQDRLARHYDGPLPTTVIPNTVSPSAVGHGGQHSPLHRATVEALGYNERRNCDPCARRAA